MAFPPPPYSNITGTSAVIAKYNQQESIANADGNARPGQIVVDVTNNNVYIGNVNGNLELINTGGGGTHADPAGPVSAVQFNSGGNLFGGTANITVSGTGMNVAGNLTISSTGNLVTNRILPTTDGNVYVGANLLPSANTYNLGLASVPWANAFFGPQSVVIMDISGNLANATTLENINGNTVLSSGGFSVDYNGNSIFRVEATTGQLYSNAKTIITNDTQAANTTSGSLQTAGGAGIAKNLYVGGDINNAGNLTVSSDQIPDNIDVNGTNYSASFVVNDTGADHIAQTLLTRFSTSVQPIIATALNNSDDPTANADVVNGQTLFQLATLGFAGTDYKEFGGIAVLVDDNGTVSETSSPGKMDFRVTPDGSVNTNTALTIFNDSTSVFYGLVNVNGTILGRNAPTTAAGASGDLSGMVAFDLNYMYYCYQDFATAAGSNIWARTQNTKNWA